MIVYGKTKKKARSQAARSVEGSAQLIQELTAKLSKKTEPTKKNEKGRKFGSYYITGDEWGMKKRPKYEWSAGKQI